MPRNAQLKQGMAFALQGDGDLTTDPSSACEYEADAEPLVDKNVYSNENKQPKDPIPTSNFGDGKKDVLIGDWSNDDDLIDCDHLLNNSAMPPNPGEFKFENSAVEIANSSSVHIGNSFHQKTDIAFDRATSVIVDRRQWNYINCSDTKKVIEFFIDSFITQILSYGCVEGPFSKICQSDGYCQQSPNFQPRQVPQSISLFHASTVVYLVQPSPGQSLHGITACHN